MNQQHLMKFTIRQMERARKEAQKSQKKNHDSNFMSIRLKELLINWISKGGAHND
jgi:hypothetical protein